MKRISLLSLLLAIGVSMTLASGCGNKTDTAGSSATQAEIDADKEKEIQKIQNDKTMPEPVKAETIAAIRAQGK